MHGDSILRFLILENLSELSHVSEWRGPEDIRLVTTFKLGMKRGDEFLVKIGASFIPALQSRHVSISAIGFLLKLSF
jgi:hypothetical protein